MRLIKPPQLPSATSVGTDDYFIISQNGVTKKVNLALLQTELCCQDSSSSSSSISSSSSSSSPPALTWYEVVTTPCDTLTWYEAVTGLCGETTWYEASTEACPS